MSVRSRLRALRPAVAHAAAHRLDWGLALACLAAPWGPTAGRPDFVLGDRVLSRGGNSSGSDVADLITLLIAVGSALPPGDVFNAAVEAAVIAFQTGHGLTADGVVRLDVELEPGLDQPAQHARPQRWLGLALRRDRARPGTAPGAHPTAARRRQRRPGCRRTPVAGGAQQARSTIMLESTFTLRSSVWT